VAFDEWVIKYRYHPLIIKEILKNNSFYEKEKKIIAYNASLMENI
jgi:hypothetical protein